jgi:integrase
VIEAWQTSTVIPCARWAVVAYATEMRYPPIPVADTLLEMIAAQVERWPSTWVLTGDDGDQLRPREIQREIQREIRDAREKVEGLPEGYRYHDLRHLFASLLIASGADVKVVQHRMRHSAASTMPNTSAELWPTRTSSPAPRSRR